MLLKLAPIFERSLGLTGVACSLCGTAPANGQLLLCDGTDCAEGGFACGGVTCVPDGDWRCRGCAPVSLDVASQKWAQCDGAKWRRLPSHIPSAEAAGALDLRHERLGRGPGGVRRLAERVARAAAGSSLTGWVSLCLCFYS